MATFDYTISVRGVECDNYMPTPRPAVPGNAEHQRRKEKI
jgi:hypothetical protein